MAKSNPIVEHEDPDLEITFAASKNEQKIAEKLLLKYVKDYSIKTISDKEAIKQIIFLELMQYRLQEKANDLYKDSGAVPLNYMNGLQQNMDAINKAKEKLGMTRDKGAGGYNDIELLKEKFKAWRNDNQVNRQLVCPHCSQFILLKMRTDIYDNQKHPFFKDRILGNEHLIRLYKGNKLKKEDLAKIFETSPDYIDWLVNKWKVKSDQSKKKVNATKRS